MRAAYANCHLPDGARPDRLLTDETSVADAFPGPSEVADIAIPGELAFDADVWAWRMAFSWFRDDDPTVVEGISAADIAGSQVGLTLLVPALRGVLEAQHAGGGIDSLDLWRPGVGSDRFRAVEEVQAEAFALALGVPFERHVSDDARNLALVAKYEQTRDPEWLTPEPGRARAQALAAAAVLGARGALARRDALLVYEYNPTAAFASRYVVGDGGLALRLARCRTARPQLGEIPRAGARLVIPPAIVPGSDPVDLGTRSFVFGDVDLWPLLKPRLEALIGRYRTYVRAAAPAWRRLLRRHRVSAVLVPFDSPPEPRMLLRVAQAEGIPTFAINDGFKADDFSPDGMSADRAFAWSESVASSYFARRADGGALVTGNPKTDAQRRIVRTRERDLSAPLREVLVGSFTFSPVDIACRRSDAEWFLEGVIAGLRASARARDAHIRVKLHPADRVDHYAGLVDDGVELLTSGDVVDLFAEADLYVTTYSTSLLEAMALGLPSIYFRINDQRLHAPFSGDALMDARTARSASELAALVDDPALSALPPEGERAAWLEKYLGPADGLSVQRIAAAIAVGLA